MLQTDNLSYTYNSANELRFPNISVNRNEKLLMLGKSGSGKTTFLHLVSGLLNIHGGSIKVDNISFDKLNTRQRDNLRGTKIGIVFQRPHLISTLTVYQNLHLAQFFNKNKNHNRILEVLDDLNVLDKKNARPHELSQGEKQRVTIARAVINKPVLILADEPTSSLDDENVEKVMNLIMDQANKNNAALLITTHDQRIKSLFNRKISLS